MAEQRKEGEDGQLLMREGIHELSESQEKQHQPNTLILSKDIHSEIAC